jgi:ankyrin repeat protein
MTKLLINAGCSIDALDLSESLPLHYAASEDKLETVELLLLKRSKVNYSNLEGKTPLHLAVRTGNSDIVRLLVVHGCSVNDFDKYGQTPLHMAAEYGKSDIVQTLMNRGANENLRDSDGRKAEQVALDKGSVRVMKVMREHRDSMIMYSQENLVDMDYLGRSRTNMACVSNQTLDDIEETEDLVGGPNKPTSNGIASLSKLESNESDRRCGCCVIL